MSAKAGLVGFLALGLFMLALAFRMGDLAWMALVFASYAAIGLFQSPSDEEISLTSLRSATKRKLGGDVIVEVSLKIRNGGRRAVLLDSLDPLPSGLRIVTGSPGLRTVVGPGEERGMSYAFEAVRGLYRWKGIRARVGDPCGLFQTEVELDAGPEVFVHPKLERMKPLPLRPRGTLPSPGVVPTRLGGAGTDFWGLREYHRGDPLKLLDWRLTARHPHAYFTREFVVEKAAEITLILDARGKAQLSAAGESLFEIEARAAASICETLLRQGQRVGLIVASRRSLRVLPDFGRLQLRRILNCLARAGSEPDDGRDSLFRLPLGKISRASTIVVMSPSDAEDLAFYRRLRALGHEVLLVCPDVFGFVEPTLGADRATRLALRSGELERRINLSLVSQLSVTVIDWRLRDPLWPQLRGALARRRP